jgi:hemoglobin-like flavoprotein
MTDIDLISASLDVYSARVGDMTPHFYRHFFEIDPTAASLMEYSDEPMRGRMLASVLELFMSDEHLETGGYLDWELDNHLRAYGATPAMYECFFESLLNTLAEGLGDEWTNDWRQTWQDRVSRIMTRVKAIESHAP